MSDHLLHGPSDSGLYDCPNGHVWRDQSNVEVPLVNIKCPHCGCTATIRPRDKRIVTRWPVQPLRRLEADVPKEPS